MNYQEITMTLAVANFLLTWGVALYMYLANKNKVTNERIQKLEEELDERLDVLKRDQTLHDTRMARLEEARAGALRHEDLEKIFDLLRKQGEETAEMRGRVNDMNIRLSSFLNQLTAKGINHGNG